MLLIDLATEEYINDPRYEELVHQAYSMRPYIFQLEARINKYELNVIDIYNREHKANERKLEKLLRGIKWKERILRNIKIVHAERLRNVVLVHYNLQSYDFQSS